MADERTPLLQSTSQLLSNTSNTVTSAKHDPTFLKLGKAYGAIRASKLPTTAQTCLIIENVYSSDLFTIESNYASRAGGEGRFSMVTRRVIEDLKGILANTENLLQEKNGS